MIKEITAGALEIMNDVSRLKVIQLWAGKTGRIEVRLRRDLQLCQNLPKMQGSTTLQKNMPTSPITWLTNLKIN